MTTDTAAAGVDIDIQRVMEMIPHRYPFLFIDRVVSMDGFKHAVAIKNVTFNEPHFQGHWPGQPIFPGVLQVEALAQLAGVLHMRRMENTGKIAVLLSLDKVKFRSPVRQGDQLILEATAIRVRSNSGHIKATARVGGNLAAEAEIKFVLTDA